MVNPVENNMKEYPSSFLYVLLGKLVCKATSCLFILDDHRRYEPSIHAIRVALCNQWYQLNGKNHYTQPIFVSCDLLINLSPPPFPRTWSFEIFEISVAKLILADTFHGTIITSCIVAGSSSSYLSQICWPKT